MKELNELVGQAEFIADWHGSDWSSALCQDKDGKQAHEIICESRGESVISTGSNSNEASWLCDYLELCSPANILAIAEAFRALEQERDTLQAKLAELEKQEPVACKKRLVNHRSGQEHSWTYHGEVDKASQGDVFRVEVVPLFERPAPAVSLAELVPESIPSHEKGGAIDAIAHWCDGYNSCRAAILRKIEEQSK